MKKALFFDIDGTVVSDITKSIPESTARALAKAKENGHLLFINTGRTFCRLDDKIKALGFDGYICGCGIYIIYHDEVLLNVRTPKKRMVEIVDMAQACNFEGVFEDVDVIYYSEKPSRFEEIENLKARYLEEGLPPECYLENGDYTFSKFYALSDENSDVKRFFDFVSTDFDIIDREHGAYEFAPKGHSKASAIEFICKKFGIAKKDTYTFGDSGNDLTMFMGAGHTIAMGHHSAMLEPYTEFVTKTVEDDGIEYAMKHYKLI